MIVFIDNIFHIQNALWYQLKGGKPDTNHVNKPLTQDSYPSYPPGCLSQIMIQLHHLLKILRTSIRFMQFFKHCQVGTIPQNQWGELASLKSILCDVVTQAGPPQRVHLHTLFMHSTRCTALTREYCLPLYLN